LKIVYDVKHMHLFLGQIKQVLVQLRGSKDLKENLVPHCNLLSQDQFTETKEADKSVKQSRELRS
jgi:hypothetical protein